MKGLGTKSRPPETPLRSGRKDAQHAHTMEKLSDDMLESVMAHLHVDSLRAVKAVTKAWTPLARRVLTSAAWQEKHDVSLMDLLQQGRPPPHLLIDLIQRRPRDLGERIGNHKLLPLQWAASRPSQCSEELVEILRDFTRRRVSGGIPSFLGQPRELKTRRTLRRVRTRVSGIVLFEADGV